MTAEPEPDAGVAIQTRLQRLSLEEKLRLIAILRQLETLADQLADLRLFLPTVEVRFFGLPDEVAAAAFAPESLLGLMSTDGR